MRAYSSIRLADQLIHLIILSIVASLPLFTTGQVGVNTTGNAPDASAGLDVDFSDRGILIPRLSTEQRNSIENPAFGLLIMNTTTGCLNLWLGASWKQICGDCDFAVPAVGNSGPICDGETLLLTAGTIPDAEYIWTGPNGFVSTEQNPSLENATPSASGLYSVTATVDGCSASAQSTVATVNVPPSITNASLSQVIGSGESTVAVPFTSDISVTTFSWTASATSGLSGFSATGTGNSLPSQTIVNSTQTTGTVTYTITPAANGCTGTPVQYVITVSPPPGTSGNPLTSTTQADNYSLASGNYYFQFPGATGGSILLYYQSNMADGAGFVRTFQTTNNNAPTINYVGYSFPWTKFLIQTSDAVTRATAYFPVTRLFNTDSSNDTSIGGSHPGYRVFIGIAGGMGIYNTNQMPCNWGNSDGSVASGYAPCGTWPNDLNFGTGTSSATYNFINKVWEVWIAN